MNPLKSAAGLVAFDNGVNVQCWRGELNPTFSLAAWDTLEFSKNRIS